MKKKFPVLIACLSLAALLAMGCAGSNGRQGGAMAPTLFKLTGQKTLKQGNGDYFTTINLSPVGTRQIPLIYVDVETRNGAIIKSLTVSGQSQCMGSFSAPGKHSILQAKDVQPQNISIQIITDKDPSDFQIGIKPFLASK